MSSLLSFRTWFFCIKLMRSRAGVELVNIVNSAPLDITHNLFVYVPNFFRGCQGRRTGVGVTTVYNSLILGGWVTKGLKNGDKK